MTSELRELKRWLRVRKSPGEVLEDESLQSEAYLLRSDEHGTSYIIASHRLIMSCLPFRTEGDGGNSGLRAFLLSRICAWTLAKEAIRDGRTQAHDRRGGE